MHKQSEAEKKNLYAFIANVSSKKSYVENLHKNCHHTAALAAFGFRMEINRKIVLTTRLPQPQ